MHICIHSYDNRDTGDDIGTNAEDVMKNMIRSHHDVTILQDKHGACNGFVHLHDLVQYIVECNNALYNNLLITFSLT